MAIYPAMLPAREHGNALHVGGALRSERVAHHAHVVIEVSAEIFLRLLFDMMEARHRAPEAPVSMPYAFHALAVQRRFEAALLELDLIGIAIGWVVEAELR